MSLELAIAGNFELNYITDILCILVEILSRVDTFIPLFIVLISRFMDIFCCLVDCFHPHDHFASTFESSFDRRINVGISIRGKISLRKK